MFDSNMSLTIHSLQSAALGLGYTGFVIADIDFSWKVLTFRKTADFSYLTVQPKRNHYPRTKILFHTVLQLLYLIIYLNKYTATCLMS